jgi:hypothetical protein
MNTSAMLAMLRILFTTSICACAADEKLVFPIPPDSQVHLQKGMTYACQGDEVLAGSELAGGWVFILPARIARRDHGAWRVISPCGGWRPGSAVLFLYFRSSSAQSFRPGAAGELHAGPSAAPIGITSPVIGLNHSAWYRPAASRTVTLPALGR